MSSAHTSIVGVRSGGRGLIARSRARSFSSSWFGSTSSSLTTGCPVIVVIVNLKIFAFVFEILRAALGVLRILVLGELVNLVKHLVSDLWPESDLEGPLKMLTQDLSVEFLVEQQGVLSGAISSCVGLPSLVISIKLGSKLRLVVELSDGSVPGIGAKLDEICARELVSALGQDIQLEVDKTVTKS